MSSLGRYELLRPLARGGMADVYLARRRVAGVEKRLVIKRLPRVTAPTLLLFGAEDKVVPFGYAKRFADALGGKATIAKIEGAGHLADLDQPDATAAEILKFLS